MEAIATRRPRFARCRFSRNQAKPQRAIPKNNALTIELNSSNNKKNLHIDGGQTTVGDGAADSTGQSKAGVQSKAGELTRLVGSNLLDDGIDLGRASGLCVGGHCE